MIVSGMADTFGEILIVSGMTDTFGRILIVSGMVDTFGRIIDLGVNPGIEPKKTTGWA